MNEEKKEEKTNVENQKIEQTKKNNPPHDKEKIKKQKTLKKLQKMMIVEQLV